MTWLCLPLAALINIAAAYSTETTEQVSFEVITNLPSRSSDEIIVYGEDDTQFIEFWHPQNTDSQAPTIVLAHGGCWLNAFAVDHVRAAATHLADAGFAVWAVEYRRLGDDKGGWPHSMQDMVSGLDLLHELAPPQVDLDRTAVAGHSAGGHLALLAVEQSRLQPRLTIGLAAITDIHQYAAGTGSCNNAAAQFITSASNAGQDDLNVSAYSALTRVLFYAKADNIVDPEQAQLGQTKTIAVDNAGHFDFVHPDTPAWQAWVDYLTTALSK